MTSRRLYVGVSVLLLIPMVVWADAPKEAVDAYRAGYAAARQGQWQEARNQFTRSYTLWHSSSSALWIADTYRNLGNRQGADLYARRSLSDPPALTGDLRRTAEALIAWASDPAANDMEEDWGAKGDGATLAIPRQDALGSGSEGGNAGTGSGGSINLNGVWHCSDGGVYYIRQDGNTVWWLGMDNGQGTSWSNVFFGHVYGNTLQGSWADVPRGTFRNRGSLVIRLESQNTLRKTGGSDGFGTWTR